MSTHSTHSATAPACTFCCSMAFCDALLVCVCVCVFVCVCVCVCVSVCGHRKTHCNMRTPPTVTLLCVCVCALKRQQHKSTAGYRGHRAQIMRTLREGHTGSPSPAHPWTTA